MSAIVDELRDIRIQKDRVAAQAKTAERQMGELAHKEKLSAGEQRQFDDLVKRADKLSETSTALATRERELLSDGVASGDFATVAGSQPGSVEYADDDSYRSANSQIRGEGLRAVSRSAAPDHAKEAATVMIEAESPRAGGIAARWAAATANPSYMGAFVKLLRDPIRGHMEFTAREHDAYRQVQEVRTFMSLTDGNGGYMVPFTLEPQIILSSSGSVNPIRRIANVKQIATDTWNGVSSAGVTAEWIAENTQVADASPTLTQPSVVTHKGDAFVAGSFEIAEDSPGFVEELTKLLIDAKEQLEATAFWSGTGSGQPIGIETALAGGSSVVTATTSETFTGVADAQKLLQNIPARFRSQAQFVAEISTIHAIQNDLGGGSNANKPTVLSVDAQGNMRLLLRPLYEYSAMDAASAINAAATATNHVLLAGAWDNYVIADRVGSRLEFIPNLMGANGRPQGSRGWLLWFRVGADSVNDAAFRVLNVATTA